jgi:type VI secretion system protein ImpA
MASPDILDFTGLLAPISEEIPVGENLREDYSASSAYYAIKDARNSARAAERAMAAMLGDEDEGPDPPNWSPVVEMATRILTEKSKDLEITAWLIEALVRVHGFAGLRDGFRLARELTETFWDDLYPRPDEDGLVTKIAPLVGLNGEGAEGTLVVPIAMVPITGAGSGGPFSAWHHDQAREVDQIADEARRAARIAAGAITKEDFDTVFRETDGEFLRNLVGDIARCGAEYEKYCAALDERCGAEGPPTSSIRDALDKARSTVTFLTKGMFPEEVGVEEEPEGNAGEDQVETAAVAPAVAAGTPAPAEGLQTREDAFRSLEEIARFFREQEPHSPLSYILERAVRWGRMPLPELLNELVNDESARSELFRMTGMRDQ